LKLDTKDLLKEAIFSADHGKVIVKEAFKYGDGSDIGIGEEGIVTAFLPEDDKYAVMFTINRWITFDKISFEKFCEYESNAKIELI